MGEVELTYYQKWLLRNPDYFKIYANKNREKLNIFHKEYVARNREKINKYQRERLQLKKKEKLEKKIQDLKNKYIITN